jgi:hypothetical protein
MKKEPRHYYAYELTIALVLALAMIVIACSPKPSQTTLSKVTESAAVKLVFTTQPSGAEAGSVFATLPVVAAEDINGNVVSGSNRVVILTITGSPPGSGGLFGGTTVTSANGIFKFKELAIDQAGTYTLTATSSGLNPAISAPFNITPIGGAKLIFNNQIVGASAGSPLAAQPVLTVVDMYGNKSTSSPAQVSLSLVPITPESYDAALSGTTSANAIDGVVEFKGLSVDITGSYVIIASSGGLIAAQSNVFDITPSAAVKLFFNTQPVTTTPGSPLTVQPPAIAVLVQDIYGNTVTDSSAEITVTITPNTGTSGAMLSGVTKLKASSGVGAFEGLSIDMVGKGYTLTASSSGLTSAVSDTFDITPAATSSNSTAP